MRKMIWWEVWHKVPVGQLLRKVKATKTPIERLGTSLQMAAIQTGVSA